jgi:hypothetical protein
MDTTFAPTAPATTSHARLRSVGAVVGGFVSVFVLSTAADAVLHATGVYPPAGTVMSGALFGLALAYRTLFTVLGGAITARLAPSRPVRHGVILGAIGTLAALAGVIGTWNRGVEFGPKWYPIALVVLAVPSTWLGARLARRQGGRRR